MKNAVIEFVYVLLNVFFFCFGFNYCSYTLLIIIDNLFYLPGIIVNGLCCKIKYTKWRALKRPPESLVFFLKISFMGFTKSRGFANFYLKSEVVYVNNRIPEIFILRFIYLYFLEIRFLSVFRFAGVKFSGDTFFDHGFTLF